MFKRQLFVITDQEGYYGGIYQQYTPDYFTNQGPPPGDASFLTNGNSTSIEMPQIAHQGDYYSKPFFVLRLIATKQHDIIKLIKRKEFFLIMNTQF